MPTRRAWWSVSITSPYTSSWSWRTAALPNAHGHGGLVAGQPFQHQLGEPPLAGRTVHDLELGKIARHREKEPVAPCARLVSVTGGHEGIQDEGRVAQPAIAIGPVALSAQGLGK